MRTLQVRIWNPEDKKMVESKDKNGVLIYEGDIIAECTIGQDIWESFGTPATVEITPKGVVVWSGFFWNVEPVSVGMVKFKNEDRTSELYISRYDGLFDWDNTIFEIIGNIFETPELLK